MGFKQWTKKVVSNFKKKQRDLETKKERELAAIEEKYSYLIEEDNNIKRTKEKGFKVTDFLTFWLI